MHDPGIICHARARALYKVIEITEFSFAGNVECPVAGQIGYDFVADFSFGVTAEDGYYPAGIYISLRYSSEF